jgi:hypothetical protein
VDTEETGPEAMGSMPDVQGPVLTSSKLKVSSAQLSESHIVVVEKYSDRLEALVPSLQGDLSAAHAAILNGLGAAAAAPSGSGVGLGSSGGSMHINEVLTAETAFLEVCDMFQVSQRLKTLAETRAER